MLNRRRLIANGVVATAATLLQGCPWHDKNVIRTGKLTMPGIDPALNPLTIDAHCHIFNGSDLQVKEFVARVVSTENGVAEVVVEAVASILQFLVWDDAPNGDREFDLLEKLIALGSDSPTALIGQRRNEAYGNARNAILKTRSQIPAPAARPAAEPLQLSPEALATPAGQSVAGAAPELKSLMRTAPTKEDVLDQIYASFQPDNYQDHINLHKSNVQRLRNFDEIVSTEIRPKAVMAGQAAPSAAVGFTALGVIQYLAEGFQYRMVQAQDYLDTFTKPAKRSVDLIVACMVDYDWWLNQGKATPTPLYATSKAPSPVKTQLEVMEKISVLSMGQVHGFVPFDPLREVAFRAGKGAGWSSLEFVKDAVMNHGCIGVKMYPPMGFAPYGNAAKANSFWTGYKFPDWMSEDISYSDGLPAKGLGQRLDDALGALYEWCSDDLNQVPILAHSNQTNGVAEQFKQLAAACYWAKALAKYPKLRVSFGHLGDLSGSIDENRIPDAAQAYIDLFSAASGAFGDSAFDAEILKYMPLLEQRYRLAYAEQPAQGARLVPERLMYGTDWNLVMTAGDIGSYMESFVTVIDSLPSAGSVVDGHSVRDRFFGWNAAEYLGLKKGQPARNRLEAFYKKNEIDVAKSPPGWMPKVDQSS